MDEFLDSALPSARHRGGGGRFVRCLSVLAAALVATVSVVEAGAAAPAPTEPDFGPNVMVFDPSMSTSQIQAAVDAVAAQQVPNQFGRSATRCCSSPAPTARLPTLSTFRSATTPPWRVSASPRTTSSSTAPSTYATSATATSCVALNNFWRSLSNLTINVTTPDFGCYSGEFWAVSQAAPMRRVHVNGLATLMDYCTGPSFASGGFIADSEFDGSTVVNGSQQQWLVRNSTLDGWTNGVWNQVFSGVEGAPAQCFPAQAIVRRPLHDARDQPGDARGAISVRGLGRALQRLRSLGAAATPSARRGRRGDRRLLDPDRPVLHRQAERRREDDQQRARTRPEPDLHAGHLPPRSEHRRQASRHRRARPRLPDPRARERGHCDDSRRREGRRNSPGCCSTQAR